MSLSATKYYSANASGLGGVGAFMTGALAAVPVNISLSAGMVSPGLTVSRSTSFSAPSASVSTTMKEKLLERASAADMLAIDITNPANIAQVIFWVPIFIHFFPC